MSYGYVILNSGIQEAFLPLITLEVRIFIGSDGSEELECRPDNAFNAPPNDLYCLIFLTFFRRGVTSGSLVVVATE